VRLSIRVFFTATLVLVSFNVLVLFGLVFLLVEQILKVSLLVGVIILNHGCAVVMVGEEKVQMG